MLNSHHKKLAFFRFLVQGSLILSGIWFCNLAYGQSADHQHDSIPAGLDSSLFSPPTIPLENRVRYSRNILSQSFDFQLEPVSSGKFNVNITGGTRTTMSIKVYDVIGNLLYEDEMRIRGFLQKEVDLSEYKSNFFIIEISDDEENKTKSIVAL